jgi:hypothetical protein
VSSSFCFHFVWFRFGSIPAPGHHNHSLAPGPIFGVRLRPASFFVPCLVGLIAFSTRLLQISIRPSPR